MNTDADRLKRDSMLQSERIERQSMRRGDESVDLFERGRTGDLWLECL